MINTPGLRLSLVGGIAVAVGLIALLFLPDTLPAALMMLGGDFTEFHRAFTEKRPPRFQGE